jgi:hypothetical protein
VRSTGATSSEERRNAKPEAQRKTRTQRPVVGHGRSPPPAGEFLHALHWGGAGGWWGNGRSVFCRRPRHWLSWGGLGWAAGWAGAGVGFWRAGHTHPANH